MHIDFYKVIESGQADEMVWSKFLGFPVDFCKKYSDYLNEIYFLSIDNKNMYHSIIFRMVIFAIKRHGLNPDHICIDIDDLINFIDSKIVILKTLDKEFPHLNNESIFLKLVSDEYSCIFLNESTHLEYKRRLKMKIINGTFDKVRKRKD
jgi:hypothetical protein